MGISSALTSLTSVDVERAVSDVRWSSIAIETDGFRS